MNQNMDMPMVPGFTANGIHVGIKADGRKDLSLFYSAVPAKAAGVFTTNRFKAAPVLVDAARIKSGTAQAILANSGNANAATGREGYEDALALSKAASGSLGIDDELVQVASTGIIGQRVPVRKIAEGIENLVAGLRPAGIADAGEAIMTTDKFPKISCRKALVGSKEVTLCGIAKGAGMISPQMATMLAFFLTDADIDAPVLSGLFRQAVNKSFNAITVDGCMSTNDTAIILANGLARNKPIKRGAKDYFLFKEILFAVALELAQAIVRDGEGATKVIEITIEGAASTGDARKAAYAVADSNLVKTAFFGCDPNWGRIISALGASGADLIEDAVEVFCEDLPLFAGGKGVAGCSQKLGELMAQPTIKLRVNLGAGKKNLRLYTSDLTFEYVKINAHYHT